MKPARVKPITIAIDGYSSTGKSTMARALAKKLNYKYIDTGAMYRGVTLFALENEFFNEVNTLNEEALKASLPKVELRFSDQNELILNARNVEGRIRGMEVSQRVSKVAALAEVRTKLVAEQQAMGKEGGIVMDGRDIGTVVFPRAELKIFMTAHPTIRAKRRLAELQSRGEEVNFEEVLENLEQRDHLDTTRAESPLKQAEDVQVLDNSDLTEAEQLEIALDWAKQRGAKV